MESLSDITWEQVPCPLCGSERWSVRLAAKDLLYGLPGEFQLVRCADCRHHFVNPRPTPDCIHRFYPKDYVPHHPPRLAEEPSEARAETRHPVKGPWYLSRPVRSIPGLRRLYYWLSESHAEIIPEVACSPKRALELGCADGQFLERLQRRGWEPVGVELAADPARRAQARGLQVHAGRFEAGQFPAGSFDAVFAWMLLEHLHDPAAALGEIRRILKDSAWLVFSVPNYACWEPSVFGRYWYSLQLPTHLHQFNAHALRRLLRRNGFGEIRAVHQRNLLNVVGSVGLWLRERFPGSRLGPAVLRFTNDPGLWGTLAMAPPAILAAWLRQGGRLTVTARAV